MPLGTLPVILLLGAKSTHKPLAAIPRELSTIKSLLESRQASIAYPFTIRYEPYFTQEQLKTTLDQLAGKIAILHFAGHSDYTTLQSDDQAVVAEHIASHIGTWSQPPDLVFLNGCQNEAQVASFHTAGVSFVIATRRAVNDALAAGFAREFYASLLADDGRVSLQAAFTRAASKVLGYYITFADEKRRFAMLPSMPCSDETKLRNIIRFLEFEEFECIYNDSKQKADY